MILKRKRNQKCFFMPTRKKTVIITKSSIFTSVSTWNTSCKNGNEYDNLPVFHNDINWKILAQHRRCAWQKRGSVGEPLNMSRKLVAGTRSRILARLSGMITFLLCKNFKTSFKYFVARIFFSPQLCPVCRLSKISQRSWARLWTKGC